MKTTVHAYCFDMSIKEDKTAYAALRAKLIAQGLKCFCTHGSGSHYLPKLDGVTVELESDFVTYNQWNTAPIPGVSVSGFRVFDWAEDYNSSLGAPRNIKRGHYLDQTEEMATIRRVTLKCGYCGKMEHVSVGNTFCPHCLGSEYLEEKDLPLLRLLPAGVSFGGKRPELTEAEKADLLPRYRHAQIHGNAARDKARIAKARADLLNERDAVIRRANVKFDGLSWLMDRGISTGNVIYYDHTDTFSFGWRNPISDSVAESLVPMLAEFPFTYEVTLAAGSTITNKAGK